MYTECDITLLCHAVKLLSVIIGLSKVISYMRTLLNICCLLSEYSDQLRDTKILFIIITSSHDVNNVMIINNN